MIPNLEDLQPDEQTSTDDAQAIRMRRVLIAADALDAAVATFLSVQATKKTRPPRPKLIVPFILSTAAIGLGAAVAARRAKAQRPLTRDEVVEVARNAAPSLAVSAVSTIVSFTTYRAIVGDRSQLTARRAAALAAWRITYSVANRRLRRHLLAQQAAKRSW